MATGAGGHCAGGPPRPGDPATFGGAGRRDLASCQSTANLGRLSVGDVSSVRVAGRRRPGAAVTVPPAQGAAAAVARAATGGGANAWYVPRTLSEAAREASRSASQPAERAMDETKGWVERFEGLKDLPADLRQTLEDGGQVLTVPAGTEVFAPGQSADNLLLLLGGTVRVVQLSETGREIFLYRIHPGESCVLTTACVLAMADYSAYGVAETEVAAVAIPRRVFDDLVGRSPLFREFVFRAYARRITELFTLIDEIVFKKLDVRLAERLLELARGDVVKATHQTLGVELGTAREVISRTLAEFQRRGFIEQSRGTIHIVGKAGLSRVAQGA